MATKVRIETVHIASETFDPKTDLRKLNGEVTVVIAGELGDIQFVIPFEKKQRTDDAVAGALQSLGGFLDSARRALDLAIAEYGHRR